MTAALALPPLGVQEQRDRDACARKKKYPSKQAAKDDARQLARITGHANAYECPSCHGWHVTKMKPDQVRRMRRRIALAVQRRQEAEAFQELSWKLRADLEFVELMARLEC